MQLRKGEMGGGSSTFNAVGRARWGLVWPRGSGEGGVGEGGSACLGLMVGFKVTVRMNTIPR